MKEQFTQQTINQFYAGFKKLPTAYKIEKVHQLISNPSAEARQKVNFQSNYLKLIIMTSTIFIGLFILFFWMNPIQKEKEHLSDNSDLQQNRKTPISPNSSFNSENQIVHAPNEYQVNQESNKESINQINNGNDDQRRHSAQETTVNAEVSEKPAIQSTKQYSAIEPIDGNKFILDLSFDELRKLGFNISHHAVFYRNSGVIFYSIYENLRFGYRSNPRTNEFTFYNVNHKMDLQKDTFPKKTSFLYIWNITKFAEREIHKSDTFNLKPVNHSFYPVSSTELDGTTNSIFNDFNFQHANDTLVPIVLRFSQLNTDRNKDLIFWFTPTDELFEKLPDRYSWLKMEYSKIKEAKRSNNDDNLVNYDIEKWIEEQLFTEEKINGEKFIISLTDDELEKLGCFRNEKGGEVYHFISVGKGVGAGSKPKKVDGKVVPSHDTTFFTDYMPVFNTFSDGKTRRYSSTSKELDKFLIENDKTLPVLVKNPQWKDIILWFSLSENFWKLIPERHQHLRNEYNKILFNKSLNPKKDIVQYFPEPFNKMDINVKILELNKEELENIGFIFNQNELFIDCAINQSWVKYEAQNIVSKLKTPELVLKTQNPEFFIKHSTYYKSPKGQFIRNDYISKFDSILANANQGFLPLGITDTRGRVVNVIKLDKLEEFVNDTNNDLLIPVLVKQSEFFSEYAQDKVFWFTPTEEFIERLPNRYKTELKNELEQITTKSGSSCNYFEACKSTLELENLIVYPNPARTSATIEFEAKDDLKGAISIVSITGTNLEEVVPETNFSSGFNNFQLDLSGISPGIYLIYIKTKNGFKTKRLIVSP